jgi:hypothetical protein
VREAGAMQRGERVGEVCGQEQRGLVRQVRHGGEDRPVGLRLDDHDPTALALGDVEHRRQARVTTGLIGRGQDPRTIDPRAGRNPRDRDPVIRDLIDGEFAHHSTDRGKRRDAAVAPGDRLAHGAPTLVDRREPIRPCIP